MGYSYKDRIINDSFYAYFLSHNEDDGWDDHDKYGNFDYLLKVIEKGKTPLSSSRILDVGCGTGDLAGYLSKKGLKEYVGIDIFPMSVDLARMKYPAHEFIVDDFLTHEFKDRFTYVVFSGALAAILNTDNYQMMELFLKKMWILSLKGVACNFITRENNQEKDEELFLYDFDRVLEITKKVAPNARISYEQNHAGENDEFLQTHLYLVR
ncbi:MAG: class I SAM-dependent methyltransferase [Candidatus Levybacteria bacterium]|nr:class I SAM-dependent methyltransferase [Candidatus Levybacteria bacterium]